MRFRTCAILILLSGCSYTQYSKDVIKMPVPSPGIEKTASLISNPATKNTHRILPSAESKQINLSIQGKVALKDFIDMVLMSIDVEYILLDAIDIKEVEVSINNNTNYELIVMLSEIMYKSGYNMTKNNNIYYISRTENDEVLKYSELYQSWESIITSLTLDDVPDFVELVKSFGHSENIRVLKGLNKVVVLYNTEEAKKLVKRLEAVYSDKNDLNYYIIKLNNIELDVVKEVLSGLASDIIYDTTGNQIILKSYAVYKSVNQIIKDLDKESLQFLVNLYLIDINESDKFDVGADLQVLTSGFDASTALRQSVGLGVAGYLGDITLTANYLQQKYSGKVLINPSIYIRNNKSTSLTFGSQIPTLTSSASQDNNLIQNVSYKSVGTSITIKLHSIGANCVVDLSISNSGTLDSLGVQNNPLFSSDSVTLNYIQQIGKPVYLAGFKRVEESNSRNKWYMPFFGSFMKKKEVREYVILCQIDVLSINDNSIILN